MHWITQVRELEAIEGGWFGYCGSTDEGPWAGARSCAQLTWIYR